MLRLPAPTQLSVMAALTFKVGVTFAMEALPLTVTAETLNVRFAPLRSRTEPVEEMVETEPTLEEVAVTSPLSLSVL